MRAIRFDRYGSPDVLEMRDVEIPTVGDHDVLVCVRTASANPYDWHFMTGLPYIGRFQFGLFKPKVAGLGADLSGEVEAVGKRVTAYRPGDQVFGCVNGEVPGHPWFDLGSFAEYICVAPDSVVAKPPDTTFEQAAALPMAGYTALQGLRDVAHVAPGHKVLVNGASGGVGTFAVQIAKALGAEVTGVCSTANLELVRTLGADHVVDYTREDFASGDRHYDVILDNVGNQALAACRRALAPRGVYVASFGQPDNLWFGPVGRLLAMAALSPLGSQRMATFTSKRTKTDLRALRDLVGKGQLTPVVDRVYPLGQAAAAMQYLEQGHARGKVVIRCDA